MASRFAVNLLHRHVLAQGIENRSGRPIANATLPSLIGTLLCSVANLLGQTIRYGIVWPDRAETYTATL